MRRYKKASGLHEVAKKTYSNSVSSSPSKLHRHYFAAYCKYPITLVLISEETVLQWIQEEKELICTDGQRHGQRQGKGVCVYNLEPFSSIFVGILVSSEWKNHYFKLLRLYYSVRYAVDSTNSSV